jgi:hypothetical protein
VNAIKRRIIHTDHTFLCAFGNMDMDLLAGCFAFRTKWETTLPLSLFGILSDR